MYITAAAIDMGLLLED